jgi:ArsR family transcriptional regulator
MVNGKRHIPTMARLFRALGDETRLRILLELQDGPLNVSALVKKLKMPQPTVSHHLALLRAGDLVATRRSGKEIHYSINGRDSRSLKALSAMRTGPGGFQIGPLTVDATGR